MNISAINCTPIKPHVSFRSEHDDNYQEFASKAMSLEDQFCPCDEEAPEKKSMIGTLVSLATAVLITYAGGKFAADKFSTIFKGTAANVNGRLAKFADGNTMKAVGSYLGKKSGKVAEFGKTVFDKVTTGLKSPEAFKNVAGALAVAAFVPQIATVDRNGDGIRDISQKQVNAYKGVMENLGVFSDIINFIA